MGGFFVRRERGKRLCHLGYRILSPMFVEGLRSTILKRAEWELHFRVTNDLMDSLDPVALRLVKKGTVQYLGSVNL
jgi:hypothetical protein